MKKGPQFKISFAKLEKYGVKHMECFFTFYSLFMDIHNSFMDIHDSFMDVLD